MHWMLRLPQRTGMLLLVAAPFAMAESPMPDPIAPAVIGRPLDQIGPVRPQRPKPMAMKPNQRKPVIASKKAAPAAPRKPVAAAAVAPRKAVAAAAVAPRKAVAAAPVAPAAALAAPPQVQAKAPVQAAPDPGRVAKQAVDDRVDARAPVADDVGKGTRLARKPLQPGAYLGLKHQAVVRQYYQARPAAAQPPKWKIGEPVPAEAALTGVPDEVRARLPKLPPGHQYVQVDGEVVLVALASRMVVDGVSRAAR